MRLTWFTLLLTLYSTASVAAVVCAQNHDLKSPNGLVVAHISAANARLSCEESRVQFLVAGRLVADKSFGSDGGQHGYDLVSAEWTPDSRYFIFNLSSSGGHQVLNSPILVFSTQSKRIRLLKLPPRIMPSSFRLLGNDKISVEGWDVQTQADTTIQVSLGG